MKYLPQMADESSRCYLFVAIDRATWNVPARCTFAPLQAMKDWHNLEPELFRKQPHHLPECDTQGAG
jgi:hypothetical protein